MSAAGVEVLKFVLPRFFDLHANVKTEWTSAPQQLCCAAFFAQDSKDGKLVFAQIEQEFFVE